MPVPVRPRSGESTAPLGPYSGPLAIVCDPPRVSYLMQKWFVFPISGARSGHRYSPWKPLQDALRRT